MKVFFEYFYYRIAKLNFKKNYERAIISVTVVQHLMLVNLYFFLVAGPLEIRGKFSAMEIIIYLAIFFGLDFYNYKIYKDRFDEFEEKWGNESNKMKTIGIIKVLLFIIFSFSLIFINGWIYDRFI